MDALAAKNILTRRANHLHISSIAQLPLMDAPKQAVKRERTIIA
jgi:hypothetical protein